MSHANARLTVHGRALLIHRVLVDGRPVSHVAKELGVSRQCASRWVHRFKAEGTTGLLDRSSRPHSSSTQVSDAIEESVLAARHQMRCGPARISHTTGVPARTVTRIMHRHQEPLLAWCDPVTEDLIRARRATRRRCERERPGEPIHIDVKKLGRIPDGGGWRAQGQGTINHPQAKVRIGFDYIHAVIDDHSRRAYAEVLDDEKGATSAAFLLRATDFYLHNGIGRIERVISDNAFAYRNSAAFKAAIAEIGAMQKFIKPHCPWTNGKIERFNRTLATEWAYRGPYTSNTQCTQALDPWLNHYNNERIHTGIGSTPITRVSPT